MWKIYNKLYMCLQNIRIIFKGVLLFVLINSTQHLFCCVGSELSDYTFQWWKVHVYVCTVIEMSTKYTENTGMLIILLLPLSFFCSFIILLHFSVLIETELHHFPFHPSHLNLQISPIRKLTAYASSLLIHLACVRVCVYMYAFMYITNTNKYSPKILFFAVVMYMVSCPLRID